MGSNLVCVGIIYKITNSKNGKIYIGQTIQKLEDRWYDHIYKATKTKCKTKLGRAIRKYGPESFSVEVIEYTEKLDEKEIYYIELFKSASRGYNIKLGGNGGKHGESTKKKIAKANRKRIWTEEMKERMSKSIKEWHAQRGFVPRSEDFKNKISIANSKRKMPEKTKKIFQAYNQLSMKSVICLTNGKEYQSIAEACRSLNINKGQLGQHLKGKHKHVKGFVFKYKEK